MKVSYTLPGLLPDPVRKPAPEFGERPTEPFGTKLWQLRAPEHRDWRALLRLNEPPAGAAGIGPPPLPPGLDAHDAASQRAWWRGMLDKHVRLLESAAPPPPAMGTADAVAVRHMLALLVESQRLEDEVFARHLAEGGD